MTPAAPLTLQDYAPLWTSLRRWCALAAEDAASTPLTLTRKQVAPLMRWIYILEFTLRRLVLIAAAARVISAPQKATRTSTRTPSGRPATTAHPNPNAFRLYTHTRRPRAHARHAHRTTARRDPSETPDQPPNQPHAQTQRYPLPVDPLLRASAQDLHDDFEPSEQAEQHEAPPPPAQNRAPVIYATLPLIARIALLAELMANPEPLIARAARALAHNREIATHLAEQPPPRAKGMLRTMRRIIPEILAPFHYAFSGTLHHYANANTS